MLTSVEARSARSVGLSSFAHIAAVPVLAITRDGVLFDGDLTPEQVEDVWWFLTSRNDADEAARRSLAALRDAEGTCECCREVIGYLLGMEAS